MDTGLRVPRSYFDIPFGLQLDARFGSCYPVFRKIMYPGDVFKIHADLLIRYQPMLTPPMNDCVATIRFGFVPLRLIEKNTELVITGSKDGKLSTETLPKFDSCFKNCNTGGEPAIVVNQKHSLLDYLYQIPAINTVLTDELKAKLEASKATPAAYFERAYFRFWWDYYRDENLFSYSDFETFCETYELTAHLSDSSILPKLLKKDYFTSSLPWQLKAVAAPRVPIIGSGTFTGQGLDFSDSKWVTQSITPAGGNAENVYVGFNADGSPFGVDNQTYGEGMEENIVTQLEKGKATGSVSITNIGFSGAEVRDIMSQTRIYERLARCGSRYTEYLRANFGVAPRDDTMQRAQYIGGFKTKIVTTEVVQTAGAGDNPVGTLRGHGITHGMATIQPFMAKEIGVIIGILDVMPETIYAKGVDRELTARSRFDFMNPSFQHLSEQEVRKGEMFFGVDTDSNGNLKNDETWGFQPMYQELRKGVKHLCGDMRDSLSYWNQALISGSRPSLNLSFVNGQNHVSEFNRPFVVSDSSAYPMVIDFGGVIEAYRPLVKNGTPGLIDHN